MKTTKNQELSNQKDEEREQSNCNKEVQNGQNEQNNETSGDQKQNKQEVKDQFHQRDERIVSSSSSFVVPKRRTWNLFNWSNFFCTKNSELEMIKQALLTFDVTKFDETFIKLNLPLDQILIDDLPLLHFVIQNNDWSKFENQFSFEENRKKFINKLLQQGLSINFKDQNGQTALHILKYNSDLLKWLIKEGADIHATTLKRETVLHKYVESTWDEGVELLVSLGADVNSVDSFGDTPLHKLGTHFSEEKINKIFEILISHGAILSRKNELGQTVLEKFFQNGNSELKAWFCHRVAFLFQLSSDFGRLLNSNEQTDVVSSLPNLKRKHSYLESETLIDSSSSKKLKLDSESVKSSFLKNQESVISLSNITSDKQQNLNNPIHKNLHSCILKCRNSFFFEQITSQPLFEDLPSVFTDILQFIYKGTIFISSLQHAILLLKCSHHYKFHQLKKYCELTTIKFLNSSNAGTCLRVASDLQLEELKLVSINLVVEKFDEISCCNDFLENISGTTIMTEVLKMRKDSKIVQM